MHSGVYVRFSPKQQGLFLTHTLIIPEVIDLSQTKQVMA